MRRRTRRGTTGTLALVAAAIALVAASAAREAPSPPEAHAREVFQLPNVVVVMTDDQDARSLEVMDGVQRRLAAHGTTFENFFATFPLCCPSRATFLTGQYAHNHDVRSNVPPEGGYPAFTGADTAMPVALQAEGYRTGLIGKYFNAYKAEDPVPPGWDVWRAAAGAASSAYGYTLKLGDRLIRHGTRPKDYRTTVYGDLAVRYIETAHELGTPFFLTVSTGAPHVEGEGDPPKPAPGYDGRFNEEPLPRPPSFNEPDVSDKPPFLQRPQLSERKLANLTELHRARLASLLPVDAMVERIVAELRATAELSNTYVIFTSDNGFMLGEHRLQNKTRLYEESVRVPMIIRGPDVPAGATRQDLTGNVDLAPTILDATGTVPVGPEPLDGRSLLPLATDPTVPWRQEILLENTTSVALRTPSYMYAEHPSGERELYDLEADQFQERSVHADTEQSDRIARFSQRLAEIHACGGAACP